MLFSSGPAGHTIFTPAPIADVTAGTVVFPLACRWLAGVGKDVLLHSFRELFACAQSDFDTTRILDGTCDGLILCVSHLVAEEIAKIRLVFPSWAVGGVREDHFRVCYTWTGT